MDSRRDFLKKAALLSTGLSGIIPASIQKAFAIDPEAGTTYLDAEHVVILMQENRSFDHAYGTLQGVRGFNDPRAIRLPNKNKVWLQSNAKGETYAPFRLNLRDTKSTWMSSLPHSWENQVDARNGGKYDKWLEAKPSGNKNYAHMPLTLGYYNREDLPFYYALADAFTVCDQNFCSSLTGTTPNRLYLWSGTLRDPRDPKAMANVRNENVDYTAEVDWKTFPERLEELGVSWRVYQNEISLPTGQSGEESEWLGNFTDNPLEWFSQYRVRFHPAYYPFIQQQVKTLPVEMKELEARLSGASEEEKKKISREISNKQRFLNIIEKDLETYTPEQFATLSEREKNLSRKAFTTNSNDPNYRKLDTLTYADNGTERTMKVPKGDVLHQFRTDVQRNQLPAVSWLVAPENFSDHPGAPWYGAWYISEVMDILTQNPDVWKKTIFVLCYDENDGYFDHVPPYVPAHPQHPETGKTTPGLDTTLEFVTAEQESKRRGGGRTGPIGLGYRVPLVIASPWSRGGYVCSEIFDHTSIVQLLENVVSHRLKKPVKETNISDWRRTVCGDLHSVFRPYQGEKMKLPTPVSKKEFIESIHQAQFRKLPSDYKILTTEEIQQENKSNGLSLAKQESGIRPSNALPYELYADGRLTNNQFELTLAARTDQFGTAGAPFTCYEILENDVKVRSYTVAAGKELKDSWTVEGPYHYCIHGPNGFFREFKGTNQRPALEVSCSYERKKEFTGNVVLQLRTTAPKGEYELEIQDQAYGQPKIIRRLTNTETSVLIPLKASKHWYDFTVKIKGFPTFEQRYAGRVETGKEGVTDPAMGRSIETE